MQDDGQEEHGTGDPQAGPVEELPEEDGIAVQGLGAQVDRQVAGQVSQDEAEEDGARNRHDHLAADRGSPERGCRGLRHSISDYMQAAGALQTAPAAREFVAIKYKAVEGLDQTLGRLREYLTGQTVRQ